MLKRHWDPFKLFILFFLNSFSLKDARIGIWGLFFFFPGLSCCYWYLYMGLVLAQASSLCRGWKPAVGFAVMEASVRCSLFPCPSSRCRLCPSRERKDGRVGSPFSVPVSPLSISLCQEARMFPRKNVVPAFKNRLLFWLSEGETKRGGDGDWWSLHLFWWLMLLQKTLGSLGWGCCSDG